MACFQPLLAVDLSLDPYTGKVQLLSDEGKHIISILPRRPDGDLARYRERYGRQLMMLPCGHCVACAQDYARTWQGRIMAEAEYYEKKCFVTLTYKDAPENPSKDDLRKFIKKLRNNFGAGIKFFGCGEKGSQTKRSHYHMILFGIDFSEDRVPLSKRGLNVVYRSSLLESLWTQGFSSIGSLDLASAGYVSKYCDKKKISRTDEGEFVIMSRGLGKQYFIDHKDEIFNSDFLYFNGNKFKIPRYFLTLAARSDFVTQIFAQDYADRKKEIACSFRYDKNKSFNYEELAMLDNQEILINKKQQKEGFRDVI